MITITEKAIAKVKEISESEGIGHLSIRLKVIGGGCAGMTYDMTFDNQTIDTDEVLEINGIKVVIDELSMQYLDGTTIDYFTSDFSQGFKFLNPNVKGSCGCESSISF